MFKIMAELVNKITDEKQKSEFLAELKKLEESDLITMPKTLDELFNNDKFSDLKVQYTKNVGGLRNKWDEEQKEKGLKEDVEKLDGKEQNEELKKLLKLMTGMNAKFEKMDADILGLRGEKKIDSLKGYADEKLKDIPKEFHNFIHISENTTEADIDKNVNLLITARENDLKKVNGQPIIGVEETSGTDADVDDFLKTKKEELGIV